MASELVGCSCNTIVSILEFNFFYLTIKITKSPKMPLPQLNANSQCCR